jgi:secondary thiamine-phosphate synthase enzyme
MAVTKLAINVMGQGLHPITQEVSQLLQANPGQGGICNLFLQHTSASLLIQENYDPTARADLENWLNRLVPENDPLYTHTLEGPDDMPAHIKAALTASCLSIPILDGQLGLGNWQGIFLWEHRHYRGQRQLLVHIGP